MSPGVHTPVYAIVLLVPHFFCDLNTFWLSRSLFNGLLIRKPGLRFPGFPLSAVDTVFVAKQREDRGGMKNKANSSVPMRYCLQAGTGERGQWEAGGEGRTDKKTGFISFLSGP